VENCSISDGITSSVVMIKRNIVMLPLLLPRRLSWQHGSVNSVSHNGRYLTGKNIA